MQGIGPAGAISAGWTPRYGPRMQFLCRCSGSMRSWALLVATVAALGAPAGGARAAAREYAVGYRVEVLPEEGIARVGILLGGLPGAVPSRLTFTIDPERHSAFSGNGKVETPEAGTVVWEPPSKGGRLDYVFKVERRKGENHYDARMTPDWAIFRADHLVPSVAVRSHPDAVSRSTVEFVVPEGWSALTPYPGIEGLRGRIEDPERRFDRPKGWLLLGRLGSRREEIAGVEVVVAGPTGQSLHRLDVLSFLGWTFPELAKIFPELPPRLLIVMARDPMWRGGLSGPASLFVHGDRPLVSENRTSTLLHELVHVLSGVHGDPESDWIVEGLAEFYSVELLRRTGGIGELRFSEAMGDLAAWGADVKSLFVRRSSGPTTARAAVVLRAADYEIREATDGRRSLDDVARRLAAAEGDVSYKLLWEAAEQVAGRPVEALRREHLPGGAPKGEGGKANKLRRRDVPALGPKAGRGAAAKAPGQPGRLPAEGEGGKP